jgi:LDH2 family malate/lactate/ureidoglycolate dehydrogenase
MNSKIRTISHTDLEEASTNLLQASGVPEVDAKTTARIQVEADLKGVHTHGTFAIVGYIRQIQKGEVNPVANLRTVREGGAYIHVDGDNGLGQVVAHSVMARVIEKAKNAGVAFGAAFNSNHYGASGYYANMAAQADMVGFNTSGARKQMGNMAAFGSIDAVIGNAPFAYGVPAGTENPIILDMATGVVAAGKIGLAKMKGERIPIGWGITEDGEPTDDPALAKTVVPLGPKGSGLSIIMHCIGGMLTGAGLEDIEKFGHLFIAIDIKTFSDPDVFKSEVAAKLNTIRNARRAPGVDRIYYPGEPEWIKREQYVVDGIPMFEGHITEMENLAEELGVPIP